MAQNNHLRKQAYHFYRSLGYSSKEATNLRNKGAKRLAKEYGKAFKKFTDKRVKYYRGDRKTRPKNRPYRPVIKVTRNEKTSYQGSFEFEYGIPEHISHDMTSEGDFLQLENYRERIEGLKEHLTNRGRSWGELMAELDHHHDLGDWLDALGELYDDDE